MYWTRRFWSRVLVLAIQGAAHGAIAILGVGALSDEFGPELIHAAQAAGIGALIATLGAVAGDPPGDDHPGS